MTDLLVACQGGLVPYTIEWQNDAGASRWQPAIFDEAKDRTIVAVWGALGGHLWATEDPPAQRSRFYRLRWVARWVAQRQVRHKRSVTWTRVGGPR